MDRRDFLGLALAPLVLSLPARAAQEAPKHMSHAAKWGMFPNVPLVTHEGQSVRFYDDLVQGNKTVLLNFFVVGCTDGRCPTANANLRRVQDELGERMGSDVFFYSISLQPEKDTPAVLKEYAEAFEVKPGWTFLTGKHADIDHLRRSLGFVDRDPERDKDPNNHVSVARVGNDALERWAAVGLSTSPSNIVNTLKWL
jgi:protein SCO1